MSARQSEPEEKKSAEDIRLPQGPQEGHTQGNSKYDPEDEDKGQGQGQKVKVTFTAKPLTEDEKRKLNGRSRYSPFATIKCPAHRIGKQQRSVIVDCPNCRVFPIHCRRTSSYRVRL